MVCLPYGQKPFLNGELKARLGGEVVEVEEELVELEFSLGDDLFDLIGVFLGIVLEGGADGAGDHTLELLLLLNFIAVVSN